MANPVRASAAAICLLPCRHAGDWPLGCGLATSSGSGYVVDLQPACTIGARWRPSSISSAWWPQGKASNSGQRTPLPARWPCLPAGCPLVPQAVAQALHPRPHRDTGGRTPASLDIAFGESLFFWQLVVQVASQARNHRRAIAFLLLLIVVSSTDEPVQADQFGIHNHQARAWALANALLNLAQ